MQEGLATNSSLEELDLTACNLTDDGADIVSAVLKVCTGTAPMNRWHSMSLPKVQAVALFVITSTLCYSIDTLMGAMAPEVNADLIA